MDAYYAKKATKDRQGALYVANGFLFLAYLFALVDGLSHHWWSMGDAIPMLAALLALHIFVAQQVWRDWGKRP